MICSLINTSPGLLNRMVVWALDEGAAKALGEWRKEIVEGRWVDLNGRTEEQIKQFQWKAPLGVYFDASHTASPYFTSGTVKTADYFAIMGMRREFYVRLLDDIGINFLFSDADVFFLDDPFVDLNLPFGVKDVKGRKRADGFGDPVTMNMTEFYKDLPDIVSSFVHPCS
ncbi:hypothetical protein BC829DRAFT_47957 [Chytridium lagenaria]|nr:hypothetical protein BC829DRAFT_47957 [Chytridium lagenaria]